MGCNYTLCGEITAGLLNLACPGEGDLLLFSPSFQMLGHIYRMNGLKDTLEQSYPHIRLNDIIELTGNDIKDYQLTINALKKFPMTNLFVCPGAYSCGNLQAIQELGYFKNPGLSVMIILPRSGRSCRTAISPPPSCSSRRCRVIPRSRRFLNI